MVLGAPPLAEGGVGEGGGDVMLLPYHQPNFLSAVRGLVL